MLYRSLQDQRLSAGPLYIYSQTEQVPDTLLMLTNQNSSLVAVTPLGQLTAQLLALDGAGTGLFMLTMQVTVCIVVLIALGLYYQVNTQLTNDRQLFGLQLAMGQRRGQLGLELCLRHLILSAIAAVCFIGLMAVLATSAEALNLSLLSALPITFTVLLVVSSILLVTGLAVANLTRPSLRQLLAP
jgi:ABC-type antimicrobial peptide transport system permease subunit